MGHLQVCLQKVTALGVSPLQIDRNWCNQPLSLKRTMCSGLTLATLVFRVVSMQPTETKYGVSEDRRPCIAAFPPQDVLSFGIYLEELKGSG